MVRDHICVVLANVRCFCAPGRTSLLFRRSVASPIPNKPQLNSAASPPITFPKTPTLQTLQLALNQWPHCASQQHHRNDRSLRSAQPATPCPKHQNMRLQELLPADVSLADLEDLQTQLHTLLVDRYGADAAAAVSWQYGSRRVVSLRHVV